MNMTAKHLTILLAFILVATFALSIPCLSLTEVEVNAIRDAEKDAKDFNQFQWYTGTCITSAAPFLLVSADILTGFAFMSSFENVFEDTPLFSSVACVAFFASGPVLSMGYAAFRSPDLPVDRLLGKSPAYINAYTNAYRKRVKSQQIQWGTMGCISGAMTGLFAYQMALAHYFSLF